MLTFGWGLKVYLQVFHNIFPFFRSEDLRRRLPLVLWMEVAQQNHCPYRRCEGQRRHRRGDSLRRHWHLYCAVPWLQSTNRYGCDQVRNNFDAYLVHPSHKVSLKIHCWIIFLKWGLLFPGPNGLIHCDLVISYGNIVLVYMSSRNGLLPDGTKPLFEPMITCCQLNWTLSNKHQCNFKKKEEKYKTFLSRTCIWKCHLQNVSHFYRLQSTKSFTSIFSNVPPPPGLLQDSAVWVDEGQTWMGLINKNRVMSPLISAEQDDPLGISDESNE